MAADVQSVLGAMSSERALALAAAAALLAMASAVLLVLIWRRLGQRPDLERTLREELRAARDESARQARDARQELQASLTSLRGELTASVEMVRGVVDRRLGEIRESNERRLDQMRQTVEEKLHDTLEKRLGESFRLVSSQLEAVHKGLGEMQSLAAGVGDLKKVLTNVKVRGTWGEVQLGALLEQVLTPEQYARNVTVREGSREVVEYALRLPGQGGDAPLWLPIDCKFPHEDYARLVAAAEAADADAVQRATQDLLRAVKKCAQDIRDKYIHPPHTTDFAILFLPTEGLYAEVLRNPGFVEEMQQSCRVVLAGPTTLAALLNSLRIGFRTLAIEKRASEVWHVLAAVKAEFGKFSGVLDKVKRQLETATRTIETTGARTRAIEKRLRGVETLPGYDVAPLSGNGDGAGPVSARLEHEAGEPEESPA
ncbi:MAG TPA: DNA recombination protein RmuC [Candidatus Limnocylindrales bacterium]|nr:DNA recombination protein RmuC [Candidatus Limnocylindrales bacterium]